MRSTTGQHYIALDHVRAVAALMVFCWHFLHASTGTPIAFTYTPNVFPLALLDEGHTGVALFMTLSGYLFAKLLDGRHIAYPRFLWNRVLRLMPLLIVVITAVGVKQLFAREDLLEYTQRVVTGLWAPTLPNGGWSITTEFHFYIILPFLLWLLRRNAFGVFAVLFLAIGLRAAIYVALGEVQSVAYWTIIGRFDQFALGILAFHFRSVLGSRHLGAAALAVIGSYLYYLFDSNGGLYNFHSYPSTSPLWIVMPTLEGAAYAALIGYYDNSFSHSTNAWSRFVALIGKYSYSIYLLHFFLVFRAAAFINTYIMRLDNFYIALLWAVACFLGMVPIGYLSYRFIESPFLKLRKVYVKSQTAQLVAAAPLVHLAK